jgi:4-amino-4-deoxy-L-arabinose transferase-like glycosyltransferase
LAATLLFFSRLDCPLQEPEEPRYAEIPRQMLQRGDGIVPTLQGLPYYDKPPLLYWLVMASYKLCGIQDWSARLVSTGAAFLCVLVTYLWGRRTLGLRPALVGAFILCLSWRFVYLGRLVTMNSLLCLLVVAALAAGHVAVSSANLRWRWWLLSAAATSLGLLTKGPVALVLAMVPLFAFCVLDPRTARPGARGWLGYLVISCGLACPWYLAVASSEPGFLSYFFWKHNLVRYVAPFDHAKPLWYFLPEILLGMLPWSFLFPSLFRFLCSRSANQSARRPPALGFFLLASLWSILFFSLGGSKRAGYVLPAMPPLALALGYYLNLIVTSVLTQKEMANAGRLWSRRALRVSLLGGGAILVALFLAIQLLLPWYAQRFSLRDQIWPYAARATDPSVLVVCYPRAWDSVSFYLQRSDVRVYATEQRAELIADLTAHPQTLAFIKSDRSLAELLHDLPVSLEFVPQGRQAGVAVGWVRQRWDAPPTLLASH